MNKLNKLKAWNKATKKMYEVIKIDFYNEKVGYLFADPITQGEAIGYFKFSDIDLMEYTGLKDKNGKEIYEGDICRWRDLETFNDEILEDIFVVVWNDEKLAWYTQNEDGNFGYDLYEYTDDRDLGVIGNIYENIDLLEVEKWRRSMI